MYGITTYNEVIAATITTTARKFYEAPASGACKGRVRQVRHNYGLTTKRLESGRVVAVLPSGAAYAEGRTGGLVRINHPANKHQRARRRAAITEGV